LSTIANELSARVRMKASTAGCGGSAVNDFWKRWMADCGELMVVEQDPAQRS